MTVEPEKIAAQVLALPPAVRAYLAHELIESLGGKTDPQAETEWESVIERRSREIDSGAVSCRDTSEVVGDIRAKLNASRRQSS